MGNNQNKSAGAARQTARPPGRIIGAGRISDGGSGESGGEAEQEYLEDMRVKGVHPSLQYEFIRMLEEEEEDSDD
jgi:hypothetical protein